MTNCRRNAGLLIAILCLASLCGATDKKQLTAALAAVEANLKTHAGKQYDETLGTDFVAHYLPAVKQCKQSTAGTNADPFDMFLRLNGDGKVLEALVYPETPLALCTRTALAAATFTAPPHSDYWVNIHMQPKR